MTERELFDVTCEWAERHPFITLGVPLVTCLAVLLTLVWYRL
jgi:hypothetical protein